MGHECLHAYLQETLSKSDSHLLLVPLDPPFDGSKREQTNDDFLAQKRPEYLAKGVNQNRKS